MRRLTFSEAAEADLDDIRSYIALDKPQAAARMRTRLADACETLLDFPEVGRKRTRSSLRELVTVRPYVIIYSVRPDEVSIERILHGARRR